MAYATVTLATLMTNSWNNIFTAINTIPDPDDRSTKWIYSAFPDKKVSTESSYPLIVVNPVEPSMVGVTSGSSDLKEVILPVSIEVYTTSADQLDSLSDSVYSKLVSVESSLNGYNMKVWSQTGSAYSSFTPSGVSWKVHIRILDFEYKFYHSGS